MSREEMKVKVNGQKNEIISYLESMVQSLKEGTVVVQQDEQFITLKPAETLSLKIEGERKGKKDELKIELSWKNQEEVVEEKPVDLVISSVEPATAQEEPTEDTGYTYSSYITDAETEVVAESETSSYSSVY